jgi:hypothetical protein
MWLHSPLPIFATKPPIFVIWSYFCYLFPIDDTFNVLLNVEESMLIKIKDNIDEELERFLKKNFPREVREKRIENEIIDGVSRFGPNYVHPSQSKDKCQVM